MGLAGIVCKLRDSPYRSGDRAGWLKIKCFRRGVFPIIGFIAAPGSIAALHLARREGKGLVYAGRAGTGFTQKSAGDLRQVLDALVIDKPAVSQAPRIPGSRWVRPELAAEIEYTAITREGLLRHALFKGCSRAEANACVPDEPLTTGVRLRSVHLCHPQVTTGIAATTATKCAP